MRIWVIGRWLPKKENNFQGSFEFDQAKMLAEYGHEVCYFDVTASKNLSFRTVISKNYQELVNIIKIQVPVVGVLPERVRNAILRKAKTYYFEKIAKQYGMPDIIHAHYPSSMSYRYFRIMQNKGCQIVATEHWSKVQNKSIPAKLKKKLKEFVKSSDAFICVSNLLKQSVVELTGTQRNITVIPNLLPKPFQIEGSTHIKHKGFQFIAVGRLDKIKRYDHLISTFAATFSKGSDIYLCIVGDGIERENLEREIRNHSCTDRVKLLGYVPPESLVDVYKRSDVLVVSSATETFCVPAIEALSLGLPIIVPDTVGVIDYIRDDNGIVIPSNDDNSLSDALQRMVVNQKNYDADKISTSTKVQFSQEHIYQLLLQEYSRV